MIYRLQFSYWYNYIVQEKLSNYSFIIISTVSISVDKKIHEVLYFY